VELDWWQSHLVAGTTLTLTPTKHWSNRFGTPRNHRLWGGFYLAVPPADRLTPASRPPHSTGASRRVWFAGDSGYDGPIFRDVARRCGAPDLALLPIGAYEPRWFMAPMHMNPAEAVQTHREVGARQSIGMHWGTFQLTDEAREAPVAALAEACAAAGLAAEDFRVLAPGESRII
jgi:L-ascorbate metabolism protein UlaG (beta-lactamase superfamily)